MKLFYKPGACSLSVHIILREMNKIFTLERVDLKKKCLDDGKDFSLINPKGKVPVLVLNDGNVLTENISILQYLAESKSDCQLLAPVGTMDRYKTLEWLSYGAELHQGFMPLFRLDIPEEYKKVMRSMLEKKLVYLDNFLKEGHWIYGVQFTIADAYLFTILRWADAMLNIRNLNRILRYIRYVAQRASVSSALVAEGLK